MILCVVEQQVFPKSGSLRRLVMNNGNEDSELEEYARVIKDAYRVEECFHRGKGECGLSDYQVRNWRGGQE